MGKISNKQQNKENLLLYFLHRECVRRNADYADDYFAMMKQKSARKEMTKVKLLSHWVLSPEEPLPNPEEKLDLDKLQSQKASSERKFSGGCNFALSKATNAMTPFFMSESIKKWDDLKGMIIIMYFPEASREKSTLSAINTNWSRKDMIESFTLTVDSLLEERRKRGLKQDKTHERLRLEHLFEYLKAYDLKQNGKTYKEIAKCVWPQGSMGDLERKIRLYIKKAKNLIQEPPYCKSTRLQYEKRMKGTLSQKIVPSRE